MEGDAVSLVVESVACVLNCRLDHGISGVGEGDIAEG